MDIARSSRVRPTASKRHCTYQTETSNSPPIEEVEKNVGDEEPTETELLI